jgi:hypothetical protein
MSGTWPSLSRCCLASSLRVGQKRGSSLLLVRVGCPWHGAKPGTRASLIALAPPHPAWGISNPRVSTAVPLRTGGLGFDLLHQLASRPSGLGMAPQISQICGAMHYAPFPLPSSLSGWKVN